MPTITVDPSDFQELLGFAMDEAALGTHLDLVKGEFKGRDEAGQWRVELNDTNRPDLWSAEGIARQLRAARGRRRDYPFFRGEPCGEIRVEPGLEAIRPCVAAFVVRGVRVTERSLAQLIQTQEKLAENFGRKRKDVAIGVYNLAKIRFPVSYRAVDPRAHAYVPLGFEEPMPLAEILTRHPKGIQYGDVLAGHARVPYLTDAGGLTLSMPPIINSRELGEVQPGDSELFVEATGTDLAKVLLALDILACDLADRGGRVQRVRTVFPAATPFGREVDAPRDLDLGLSIPLTEFGRLLGVPVTPVEVDNVLERYGCEVHVEGQSVRVVLPPYRADYLHPVDVVEDFAIARGYETFEPRMPRDFTAGRADPVSLLEDKTRDAMIGLGYEEIISNILTSRTELRTHMQREAPPLVEVANVMNENFAALRDSLLPCLLRVEARSGTATYPHRLFEAGEVAWFDPQAPHGSRTRLLLGALVVHREASLSEAHADLDFLAQQLGGEVSLREEEHPSFLPGRSARVLLADRPIGWLGELHPGVLERWQIGVPAAAFELELEPLL
ncbi:MAG TPA: phenylalanine--tRNA ligase subunit beta [Myxococcota bacterium]|nr:phenylalanine--tRNA ligase subunit beta [Myxococcota bacterium]HRY91990.1 phenylalanine--tRNA ligase subunit beta [Myxococcota bacterium]HSA23295.1 phenylalanine--tRNA ligase subunit beta [Myxococcota bacterium]